MPMDLTRARQHLRAFNLTELFIEVMGWDRPGPDVPIDLDGFALTLKAVAQKRGLVVLVCPPLADGQLPNHATRRKIEAQVRKTAHEHLLIFINADCSAQKWQWVRREPGRPTASREFDYVRDQKEESLLQRLNHAVFSFEEEEGLNILDVTSRVRAAFDLERVTKRFYERFKTEHDAFMRFLEGIPSEGLQRWYVSVTLNRLMFIYFIQKKQFLNGDPDYLRTKLVESRRLGADRFYRDFLCPLFFEGFARLQAERSPRVNRLLGRVPYLNGGIFARHQLEERYGQSIQIADAAFQRLFDFFDQYRWHLDERPLRADNEINPDVLGYIFEKYINQKEMGGYYTKEDITGYISQYTVLTFLLDQARSGCKITFEGPQSVWRLLQGDPDRYIYPAVCHGVGLPLPAEIAAGLDTTRPNLLERRKGWNRPALSEYALPTETWREVVARRQRYEELRLKLVEGQVHEVNELITYNLDIQQFVQDVVEACEGPELLRALWRALLRITILDPTCGSGAFLFAALNLLEPLYEACLERMQAFVDDLERDDAAHHPEKFSDFRQVLADVARHSNRRYYILKTIIVHNLYGVDIMEEAVEICKLRLFLKLVAQVDRVEEIEPLPDIDFNIRAGNTLVGFTTLQEVRAALTLSKRGRAAGGEAVQAIMLGLKPDVEQALRRIEDQAEDADLAYQQFQAQQMEQGYVTTENKAALRARLEALNAELNRALAHTYGVAPDGPAYARWLGTHRPFHWLADFYGIMAAGGFDVIIGNPPYVSITKIEYSLPKGRTGYFPDIYAHVLIRALSVSQTHGRLGMIVPLSVTFSEDFGELRGALSAAGLNWFSSYDNIPAAVFAGVSQRCTIWLTHRSTNRGIFVSPMYRWRSEYRPMLTSRISYTSLGEYNIAVRGIPKLAAALQCEVLDALQRGSRHVALHPIPGKGSKTVLGFSQSARNFVSVFLEEPPCLDGGTLRPVDPSKIGYIPFTDHNTALAALSILSGETYFWYWLTRGDGFDVTSWIISDFVACMNSIDKDRLDLLSRLGSLLHDRRYEALVFKKNAGRYVGNYNYRGHSPITRRADLLLLASLGMERRHTIDIFDYVQRVLSINLYAGEKSIPGEVKQRFKPVAVDERKQHSLFEDIDRVLMQHYGFTEEELDFIINYDIKYRMGLAGQAATGDQDD